MMIVLAAMLLLGWISYAFIIPEYHRVADIRTAGWGKDGSLYLVVSWSVRSVGPQLGHIWGLPFDAPPSLPGNLVYRLDADRRVLVKVPIEEGDRLQDRWPEIGWVGGRYAVRRNVLFDHETGESRAWQGGTIISIAPDESYLLWRDDTRGLPIIHWFESGANVPIPDTVIEWVDVVPPYRPIITPDGREIHDTVNAKPIYRLFLTTGDTRDASEMAMDLPFRTFFATDKGIVAPAQERLIDPKSFEPRKGMWLRYSGWNYGPAYTADGPSDWQLDPSGLIVVSIFPQRIGGVVGIPSESSRLRIPSGWRKLQDFPERESLPLASLEGASQ